MVQPGSDLLSNPVTIPASPFLLDVLLIHSLGPVDSEATALGREGEKAQPEQSEQDLEAKLTFLFPLFPQIRHTLVDVKPIVV